jgi:hypothetical protein
MIREIDKVCPEEGTPGTPNGLDHEALANENRIISE